MTKPASEILATNLRSLQREHESGLRSQAKIADKGKVGQRTVSRALKAENPTVKSIESMARAFGLEAWHLLHPDLAAARKLPPAQLIAQQPLAIYEIEQPVLDDLLETFDKLTKHQRNDLLRQMHAAVQANIEAARHMHGRLKVSGDEEVALHLPPAPRHRNDEGT